jgi:hypothetical protein
MWGMFIGMGVLPDLGGVRITELRPSVLLLDENR